MKNKKTLIAVIAAVLVVALLAGIYLMARPAATQGEKTFTLTVVHSEGSKEFTIRTDEEYLAPALIAEGIINDEGVQTGMYFTVDGETASWEENQSYWAIYVGDDYATVGLNDLIVEDGGVYKLEYTIG